MHDYIESSLIPPFTHTDTFFCKAANSSNIILILYLKKQA